MKNITIKSTKGDDIVYKIREAVENAKHRVVEVYFHNREYPNIISGRYKTLKNAQKAISSYQHNKDFSFWGDV